MATYVILSQYTQQGVERIKDSPQRLDAAKQAFQAMGGEVRAFYLVLGQYDHVLIVDAPDDETVAKVVLAIASRGNIRTETLRAFTEDEFRSLVTALP